MPETAIEARRLRDEVVGLTRELVRLDTSNPPGNETAAAEHLARYLGASGIECELAGPDPDRLNLIARIEGSGRGPSLMLMGHTDVVPAPSAGWSVPPFEARLDGGRLFGRGVADMKGELVARAVAFAAFAREGAQPAGDVVLLAEADEERNTADVGVPWLVRERPDLRCELALNEGGGLLLELADGRRVVTIAVGEKAVTSARVRLYGQPGHASIPGDPERSAVGRAALAVQRLLVHEGPPQVPQLVADALAALGAPDADADRLAAWAFELHPRLGEMVSAMCRMTVTPTGLETFEPANVVPPFADITCDCRALPGQGESEVRAHVEAALGAGLHYELELLEPVAGGTISPAEGRLYEVCAEYAAERANAELLPIISPGFSDSYWMRAAFDTRAYGFAPVFHTPPDEYLRGAHGIDESLEVADLAEMAEFHLLALRAVAGVPPKPPAARASDGS